MYEVIYNEMVDASPAVNVNYGNGDDGGSRGW